jgi:hypothetical protein
MRSSYAVLLPLVFAAAALTAQESAPTDAFRWRTNLAAARAEAAETGKPLFLVFRCEA